MTSNTVHIPNHTWWYRIKNWVKTIGMCIGVTLVGALIACAIGAMSESITKHYGPPRLDLTAPITIKVDSVYRFLPTDRISYRAIKGVGLTYYCRGDGQTPGSTTRSGRYVYEGGIAVSQPLWNKEAFPGDLVWVKATDRWYKVEDTMHAKYTDNRVDIYTHDMALANSGAAKTDIIIMRQPK